MLAPPRHTTIRVFIIAASSTLLAWSPDVLMVTDKWTSAALLVVEIQMFVIAAILLIRGYWSMALMALFLSPIHVRFWGGAYRYSRGAAYYLEPGSSRPMGNLDEERRVPLIDVGSHRHSLEQWLWIAPQNAAVDLCIAVFGPMPGAYGGPLPTRADVRDAVRASTINISLTMLQKNTIPIGANVNVRDDFGPRMLEAMGEMPDKECLSTTTARVALWRERVVVVAMPWNFECATPIQERKEWFSFAATLDAQSGKVLGYYDLDSSIGNNAAMLPGIWQLDSYGSLDRRNAHKQ